MADNKKYYYLKLKDNFYESDTMIVLESMENGYLYSNILMKMYLRSLKNNGRLMFNERIPYNPQMLAKIVRHNADIVEKAISIFKQLELVDIMDNGAIYMSDIQNFIGESSTEADRVRAYRISIDTEKKQLCTNVQQMYDKCTPEIEIEKEIDIEINSSSSLYDTIQENFGRLLSSIEYQKIEQWQKDFTDDMIKYAVELAVMSNAKTFRYLEGIFNNWTSSGYKTLEQVQQNDKKKIEKREIPDIPDYNWLDGEEEKGNETI